MCVIYIFSGNKMQLLAKFAKLQLKFKSNLSRLLTEKEICIKSLKEMKNKAENEITNLYKVNILNLFILLS